MNKTTNTNKKTTKKSSIKISLAIFATIILVIVGYTASISVFNKFDEDRFIKLDNKIQTIFQKLKVASNGINSWEYKTNCTAELAGDWLTGKYFCTAEISMDKIVTSVNDLNILQAKYYPIIDADINLKQMTELNYQLPNDFGKEFVVSSAEKKYKEPTSNISCTYLIKLYQSVEDENLISDSYGSKISSGDGKINIDLNCTEKALGDWYSARK